MTRMPRPVWQQPILEGVVEALIAEGIYEYRRNAAVDMLQKLAEAEEKMPLKDQVGYRTLARYKPQGLTRVLKRIEPMLEERVANDPNLRPEPRTQEAGDERSQPANNVCPGVEQEPLLLTLRLRLDKDNYTQAVLLGPLQGYLDSVARPARCDILKIVPVGDVWYDFHVRTTASFQSVWDWFLQVSWVSAIEIGA